MDPLPPELTLDRFVVEMSRVPTQDLTHGRFLDLVEQAPALRRARREPHPLPRRRVRAQPRAAHSPLRTAGPLLASGPALHHPRPRRRAQRHPRALRRAHLAGVPARRGRSAGRRAGRARVRRARGARRSAGRRRPGRDPPARRHLRRAARHRARVRAAAARAHRVRHGDGRPSRSGRCATAWRRTSDERRGAAPVRPARPLAFETSSRQSGQRTRSSPIAAEVGTAALPAVSAAATANTYEPRASVQRNFTVCGSLTGTTRSIVLTTPPRP